MTWLSAGLMATAVFLAIRPDPTTRLESISGLVVREDRSSELHTLLARVIARRRLQVAERQAAVRALSALAAELSAGTHPQRALVITGESVWPSACGAVRLDGDVVEALRADARRTPIITPLSACWAVASQQGSGLSVAVTRMSEQARIAEDIRVQLLAQMAGPRATARILMMLPIFGIAMGMMMGVDPVGWLLGTPLGLGCLVCGLALTCLGYWWTSAIATRVERLL
ncbi:MAG: type II secretion system F family protein [Candidatus Nanopelagicales bacterium]